MTAFTNNQVNIKPLDHLGLIAATIAKIGLIEKIDSRVPVAKEKGAKVTMGQRVAAMIFNGLGFIDDRLYLFEEFLSNKRKRPTNTIATTSYLLRITNAVKN